MTGEKIIATTQEIDVDVTGITMLSINEAKLVDKNIRCVGDSWWLRSPGFFDFYAAYVDLDGFVYDIGRNVDHEYGLRPALKIYNLESSNLRIGDRFLLADEQWIVISKDKALCNRIVGKTPFREDWKASDAKNYEASDVKVWLEKWAIEKGIIQEVNRNELFTTNRDYCRYDELVL